MEENNEKMFMELRDALIEILDKAQDKGINRALLCAAALNRNVVHAVYLIKQERVVS